MTFLSIFAAGPPRLVLAVVALIAPIPAFIASTRYGWQGYQMMRRQSPVRRMMGYYNPADDRHLQQGDQALHPRRLLHRALPQAPYRFYGRSAR